MYHLIHIFHNLTKTLGCTIGLLAKPFRIMIEMGSSSLGVFSDFTANANQSSYLTRRRIGSIAYGCKIYGNHTYWIDWVTH